MANTAITVDMVRGSLEEGHPFSRGKMARHIVPGVQMLFEKEIAGGSKILCHGDYYKPEESLIVDLDIKGRLVGVRFDTPSKRGSVTADLVKETRARLDLADNKYVKIFVNGGISPELMKHFIENRAPVGTFGIGSYINGAKPIGVTADLHEIEVKPIARRGQISGVTPNPHLSRAK